MVVGFEQETKELAESELKLVKQFVNSFKKRVGRDKRITAAEIELTYRNLGTKINGARIRAIVHHIRYNESIIINERKYFLISDNSGYWISCDLEEINRFAESLAQRAGSILSIKDAVDNFLTGKASRNFINENQGDLFNG